MPHLWSEPQIPLLGIMQLVHARPQYLRAIWRNMSRLARPYHLQVTLSEPTAEVVRVVAELEEGAPPYCQSLQILEAPFNPLRGKERFMELRRWQLERLPPTEFAALWDDDQLLEDPDELVTALYNDACLTYATKAFFWDSPLFLATHFPVHTSVFTFRRLPGDTFPLDRTIHAPAKIHDSPRSVVHLSGRLLDFGYMDAADRNRCWRDYKRVGKIDPATRALVVEPTLVPYSGPDPLAK